MSSFDDLRLIEDYLPIEAISAEASREKSVRKGHISTLHLWWARRPLVACRAAVFGALVPASTFVPNGASDGKKKSLGRANAAKFLTRLCRYPSNAPKERDKKADTEKAIAEAQKYILVAHAERLTRELAESGAAGVQPAWVAEFNFSADHVTYVDIVAGPGPRPRVLDMFAGGGAIPLEALRLGCEAYALDLNPVAHIIELCTLVYPQKYGKRDPLAHGMTGPKNAQGETTWGGLAAEVRYWGNWVLERVRKEIGDLYPPIPDPEVWATAPEIAFDRKSGEWQVSKPGKAKEGSKLHELSSALAKERAMFEDAQDDSDEDDESVTAAKVPTGMLVPVAYLWTRAVSCKKPGCPALVPLIKHGWLVSKKNRCVAARPVYDPRSKSVRFEIASVESEDELEFDPSELGSGRGTQCIKCGTPADLDYIKLQGTEKRYKHVPIAVVSAHPGMKGKTYEPANVAGDELDADVLHERLKHVERKLGVTAPDELLEANPRSFDVQNFGFTHWRDIFTPRQLLAMTCFAGHVRSVSANALDAGTNPERATAVNVMISMVLGRLADYCTSLSTWQPEFIKNTFNSPGLPMIFDFAEVNPIAGASGSWTSAVNYVTAAAEQFCSVELSGSVARGSAMANPYCDDQFDAVVTDPPYYDSRSYSNLADHFYVWHKRGIGHLLPEHFSGSLTPKKNEAIAAPYRHSFSRTAADTAYERLMEQAFADACRTLKPGRPMVCVYAHKTTAGWATLINSLMNSGFMVDEAWPVAMERKSRQNAMETAALASSIFLVARKRPNDASLGNYEEDVQPELQQIVRERVDTLWEMGIVGADLVIACVGAGLRAFTKYEKVEYANGEEVPAEKFLAEVEGAVLDRMMEKLFGQSGGTVSAIDPASRFYVLWRFVYKAAEIDAGEAIVFTYSQHVELDGPQGLSAGADALVEKKKAKYRARDFTERGDNDKLGLPTDDGQPAPLIDVLHRLLWLMENSPRRLAGFLSETSPDRERLRVLAQALGGAALSGKSAEDTAKLVATTAAEQSALGKLLANWRSLVDHAVESTEERSDRKAGQKRLL